MTISDEEFALELERRALEDGNGWLAGGPENPFSAFAPVTHVAVSVERLKQLKDAARKLDLLEGYGVDNWEGYGEAMREYYAEEDDE